MVAYTVDDGAFAEFFQPRAWKLRARIAAVDGMCLCTAAEAVFARPARPSDKVRKTSVTFPGIGRACAAK